MRIDFWNNGKRKKEALLNELTCQSLKIQSDSNLTARNLLTDIKHFNKKVENFNHKVDYFRKIYDDTLELKNQLLQKEQTLSLWEENLKNQKEEIRKKEITLHIREEGVKKDEQRIHKKNSDLEDRETIWIKTQEETQATLEEKISEYDRKIADLDNLDNTLESIKTDSSEEGKSAKIVVKEAIRSALKQLNDLSDNFKSLDEKYCEGTFKGFAVPFDEINATNESLKAQYEAVKKHAENTGLDFSIWLAKIENYILETDKAFNAYSFADCYRNAITGLSYCQGYAAMIEIFNAYAGGESEGTATEEEPAEDWNQYYKILFEEDYNPDFDYDSLSLRDFKRQFRKVAKKYHPDKADEENKAFYEEKTKVLNEIWAKIKARFTQDIAA